MADRPFSIRLSDSYVALIEDLAQRVAANRSPRAKPLSRSEVVRTALDTLDRQLRAHVSEVVRR